VQSAINPTSSSLSLYIYHSWKIDNPVPVAEPCLCVSNTPNTRRKEEKGARENKSITIYTFFYFPSYQMGRPPCCDKIGIKKGPWTPEEDIILVSYIQEHGPGNWRLVPSNTGN